MIELHKGDCLEIMKQIPDKSVDLICTDIPYELKKHGGVSSGLAKRTARMRDDVEFMANGIPYNEVFSEYIRVCKIPNMIIFCSNLQLVKILSYFCNKGLKTDVLVWEKTNPAPLCNNKYVSDIEYIVYVHTKGSPFNNDATVEEKKKCKRHPIIVGNKQHPTQKPLKIIENLVKVHSFENQTILDSYMGSGTTGVACKHLNRNFIGIELDDKYFDIAEKRINGELSRKAQRQQTLF